MNYDILNYRKGCEVKKDHVESCWESNDLPNKYISFSNQFCKLYYYNNQEISEIINFNTTYKTELFNILIINTPFQNFIKHFRSDFLQDINKFKELDNILKDVDNYCTEFIKFSHKGGKELKLIEKQQNQIIDVSISKILKMLLSTVKCHLITSNNEYDSDNKVFKIIEDSIKELPLLILSKVINESHQSSITEIKQFLRDIIEENANDWSYKNAVEIWLLLFTRIGSLDNILEWLNLVIKRIDLSNDLLIRTEILSNFFESLFTSNAEIKENMKDCLAIDILEQEFIGLNEAIHFVFLGVLKVYKIYSKQREGISETKKLRNESKNDPFKDIYIWEHGKKLETLKASYNDSLLTRLNSSKKNNSVKEVICSENELITLNNLGQVRSRSISPIDIKTHENIVNLFHQCWSPINFPDLNCKIEQITISWPVANENQHILALAQYGQLYSWGGGNFGKLGHGDMLDRSSPTLVKSLCGYNIRSISCGATHSSAVGETGLGFVWGNPIAFNSKDDICLNPIRLHQGIMSNIICGPYSTFLLSINKKNVYYLGSQRAENRLFTKDFVLQHYPSIIEGLPFTKCDKSEKIEKIAVNSTGVLVLLNNGNLYSLGQGLILGCTECQIHKKFDKVQCMSQIKVFDISLSETHVVILSQNDIYSWSLTAPIFAFIEESFDYSVTAISSASLINHNKLINIAWSRNSEAVLETTNILNQYENSYLSINSIPNSIDYFYNILEKSFLSLNTSRYFEQIIVKTLKLIWQFTRSSQFEKLWDKSTNLDTKINKLLKFIIQIGDHENLTKIKKIVCKIIHEICLKFLKIEDKANLICEILNKNLSSLNFCSQYLLKTLILSFHNESNNSSFKQLFQLDFHKLSDLLISVCQSISNHIINIFQNKMSFNRPDYLDESIHEILELMHQFSTVGYRIYHSLLFKHFDNTHNPINNFCCLLPLTNSIIGCFKSYLLQVVKFQKISQWVKGRGIEINLLFSKSPISWILFDVLNYLNDPHHWDILPLLPHIERLIIVLDSINMILSKTFNNDAQEIHWPLNGFSGFPNTSNIVPEPGLSWLWLLDLQRLTGLVIGNIFKRELTLPILKENIDDKKLFSRWLETSLFKYIITLPICQVNETNRHIQFSPCYDALLKFLEIGHSSQYFPWSNKNLLYSIGLQIYEIIINLLNNKFLQTNFHNSIFLSYSMCKIMNIIMKYITECFGINFISVDIEMTEIQEKHFKNYVMILNSKCNFLTSCFKESVKSCDSNKISEEQSLLINALDLISLKRKKDQICRSRDTSFYASSIELASNTTKSYEKKIMKFLKETLDTLGQFLVAENLTNTNFENDIKNITNTFLQNLSSKIFFKRRSLDRITKVFLSLHKLLDSSNLSVSSVLVQILNAMLISSPCLEDQIYACHVEIMEKIFISLIQKLNCNIPGDASAIHSQRISITVLNFLSSYNFGFAKLINILLDHNFINLIMRITNNYLLISNEKWLIIEGNGDKNLPKVCNMIGWCIIENFILNISICENQISKERMILLENLLLQLLRKIYSISTDEMDRPIFDLYYLMSAISYLYKKSECFRNIFQNDAWIKVLLEISTHLCHSEERAILYSKYNLNIIAVKFLFSIICHKEKQSPGKLQDTLHISYVEIFRKFSGFYYSLLTKTTKRGLKRLTSNITKRMEFYKHFSEELNSLENNNKFEWIFGNCNFDKQCSFSCNFKSSDKVSIKNTEFSDSLVIVLNSEDLFSGIWHITFDIECVENSVDFNYGFLINSTKKWPTDYKSNKNLLKQSSSTFISTSSTSCRLSCVIDIDQSFICFSNNNNRIQAFTNNGGIFRFFISSKNFPGSFEIQMISIKQLRLSEIYNDIEFYHNTLISPDYCIVLNHLYVEFNNLFAIIPEIKLQDIIRLLLEQSNYLNQFDLYFDKNISTPGLGSSLLFALFLLNENINNGFCRGEVCKYSTTENGKEILSTGIILNFKNKGKMHLRGLNFIDKLTKQEDVICRLYSLNSDSIVSLNHIQKENSNTIKKSLFFEAVKNYIITNHDAVGLLSTFFYSVSNNYFDIDITNYEGMEWLSEISERSKIEYHFIRYEYSRFIMNLLSSDSFVEAYSTSKSEKLLKRLESLYYKVAVLAPKPCPLRKRSHVSEFTEASWRLFESFYQLFFENELGLVKKYAHLYMENYHSLDLKEFLNKSERKILLRTLKRQSIDKNLIENFTMKSKGADQILQSNEITFSDRRRRLLRSDYLSPIQMFFQNPVPAEEYDSHHSNLSVTNSSIPRETSHESFQVEANQRLIDEFLLRPASKPSKTFICPICDSSFKYQSQHLFTHLSNHHPINCKKSFQHHASHCIKLDGIIVDLDNCTFFCASITSIGYCVCDEYLKMKVIPKKFPFINENFNDFVNEGYLHNNLLGWSGTLATEHYYYQKISDFCMSEDIRPKLDQVKILGDHIRQDVNYSTISLDSYCHEPDIIEDTLLADISFICQLNTEAIIKSLKRLEYSFLVLSSRNLVIKLAKRIFRENSNPDAVVIIRKFFFNDIMFFVNMIRLFEGCRLRLNKNIHKISNDIKCVQFRDTDFISVLVMALESSLDSDEKIHNFIHIYIQNLENFLTSNHQFFNLNMDFDASLLIRPSALLIQLLFNIVIKVLSKNNSFINDNYQIWQSEIEQLIELLSFGIINQSTVSKVKIWCLQNLMRMFQLIQLNSKLKNQTVVNMVDLCEDLSIEDSPTIHLANCNATVKKLISVLNKQSILTADCEGTMRLWDIDSIIGTEQNLKQTFLFSLDDQILKRSPSRESSEIMAKCLQMTEPLRTDLSNYLVQVGVQNIAVSPTGFYLAESLGIYLNIWTTKCIYSKPYVTSFSSLITALIFPQQTFGGLHGCAVDLLLVCLAHGELMLLKIFDNGTRVTQHQIIGLSDIQSNITTAAWDEEKNLIAVGYHDGSIILTDQFCNSFILDTLHNNRILSLLYCPYVTNFGHIFLASSSVDENKLAIWKKDKLICLLTLDVSITCIEWLSRKYINDNDHHVIITGLSTGLIQFWQFNDFGDDIQNLITFCGHLCSVLKLRVCENTNLLASGCNNGWVNVWSLKDRSLISTCNGDGFVIGIEWTPQNNLVTAFSRSQYIKIWRYFNTNTLQKNGICQWAYIRKIFLESTKIKSVKHLKNLKHFILSLHKLLNEQFLEEVELVKSGFSIVYSQYLQCLIQFTTSTNLIPRLMPYSIMEPIDTISKNKSLYMSEIANGTCIQRSVLRHYLNINNKFPSNHQLNWLFTIDEIVKLTQAICFEREIPDNIIPRWWWVWCVGSDEYVHHYLQSKWKNNFWSLKQQTELCQWYQNSPECWINEYSDSTYIWGCGNKGESGFSSKEDWIKPTLVNIEGVQQVVCGNGVTLILTCESKLMACGEGLEIIFNPFMREETYRIINVPVLNDYKITHVSASRGPESHIIAITIFGEAFSWGIGSHGKLGHGHSTTLKKPKSIEALRGKGAIMSDCGHMHSVVVTATGELYAFGLGSNGQLGIEIFSDCDTPRLVNFGDAELKIGFVSCGMSHTLALSTDGQRLYAFGDGVFGKLGVGDFKDHFSPTLVEFQKKTLLKVVCGKSFSAALTNNGEVYTWGHSDFIGTCLPDTELDLIEENHLPVPNLNSILVNVGFIVDICAGNDTTFALTKNCHLYGWGSNANNLLKLGTKAHAYHPELILIRKDIHLQQISCGRHHAAASTHSPYSYRNTIPSGPQFKHNDEPIIPLIKYPILCNSEFNMHDMTARLIFILFWNEMVRITWQFWIPQTNQHYDTSDYDLKFFNLGSQSFENLSHLNSKLLLFSQSNWNWKPFNNFNSSEVRQFLSNEFITSAMYRYLNGSMINNRTYTSLVRIDRINKKEPVFIQTCRQVLNMDAASLRLPWRAWKVKLINEGADDAGGAYDETISEICNELENDDLFPRILIPVPSDTSTFVPNPDPFVPSKYFHFLGILMATAIRTKKPIDLHLDPIFWKRMTKSIVTVDDLFRIDPPYFNSLLSMNEFSSSGCENIDEVYGVDKFVCFSVNRTESEISYKGLKQKINTDNVSDFVHRCIYYRLHEFDTAIEHVRKSFCSIVPMVLLDIMSWRHLEKMVCGSKSISIDILKNIARYVDADENDVIFSWFWEILESFNEFEKSLFLRFVTGKSRLPSHDSHIPFRLFIYISKQPANSLPQSQTCFNQIRLPRYKSQSDMETCLRIAISQCRSIDMDDYMLIRNRENDT